MNISDKIIRAKADLDSVYEAGVEKGRGEATEGAIVEPLEVDANGTYTAPDGVAYSPVKVNVPDVNGSYDEGYEDGYEKGKASGGGGLTPSEGLEFTETYDPDKVMYTGVYGVIGKGSCTDSVIVVPCANPANGRPVVCVGVCDDQFNISGFDCTGVSELHLPDTVTHLLSLAGGTFDNDTFADLRLIKFGRYHKQINSPLTHWSSYRELVWDFSELKTQSPPSLLDISDLGGVVQIKVPMAMVDKFKTATNWSVAADRIVGV